MMLARLALLTLCGWNVDPDPVALLARLSSSIPAERDEAAGALEDLGRPALPALYKARDTAHGDHARRVGELINQIERRRLLRATQVRLDFDDRPLVEVVEAIRARSGFPLVLDADDAHKNRRINLRAPEPVAFWEALDRLAVAGGVRHRTATPFAPPPRPLTIALIADDGPPFPTDHAGPFRVILARISRHRTVIPARPPSPAAVRESFTAVLHVFAEPGLAINGNGPPVLEAATDDRGQDLRADSAPARVYQPWPPRFDEEHAGTYQVSILLRLPATPGRRIRRLKGFVPITVVAQTGGPLVVPVTGSNGTWFSGYGVELTVKRLQRAEDTTTITLAFRGELPGPQVAPGTPPAPPGDFEPPFRFEDHIRILDEHDRPCGWWPGQQHREPGSDLEVPLVVSSRSVGPPARVLYHDLVGAATEVVFEFTDQPLP